MPAMLGINETGPSLNYQKPTTPQMDGGTAENFMGIGLELETNRAGEAASNVNNSIGQGLVAGSSVAPGWGTIIGGAVGLIKGIITEVAGGAADRRAYRERMNKFNRDMRRYYDNVNKYIARQREQKEKQQQSQRNQAYMADRQKKISGILQSINQRAAARRESTSRWR